MAPAWIDLLRALHAEVEAAPGIELCGPAVAAWFADRVGGRGSQRRALDPAGALITYVEVDDAMAVAPTGRYRGFGTPV